MPFRKPIVVEPTGVEVNHWRVVERHMHDQNKSALIRIGGWTQRALAVAGKSPFYSKTYSSDIEPDNDSFIDYEMVRSMNQAQLEEHIRATKAFVADSSEE